jgi:multidrug efflux pump subunit AcrA (membrane-fusion protein)
MLAEGEVRGMPTSSIATPKLRADLEPFAILEDGRTIVVLGDPATGRYFRLRAVEGTILALLDGRHDVESIYRELMRAFPGRSPTRESVAGFIEQAGRMGFLEGVAAAESPRSWLSRVLFIKVSFGNPDQWLLRLHDSLSFIYHPISLSVAVLLVLAAIAVAAGSLDELRRSLVLPRTGGELLLVWLSVSLITLIHELGHGLTCRHFGARTGGFGLLFLYFLPCFYCDVSGAWTLSSRAQRLWVGAAGLCFQFVAGAIALLLWRVLDPASLPAQACLAMVSVCGLDALVNLVPLIRLDGYYLLADWLQIPNLRPRALGYVGSRLRQWLLGLPGSRVATTPRQERMLLYYGTAAGIFAAGMFLLGMSRFYAWFHGRFGGAGALAVVAFATVLLAPPVWRLLRLWGAALGASCSALAARCWAQLRRPGESRVAAEETAEPEARSTDAEAPDSEHEAPGAGRSAPWNWRPVGLTAALAAGIAALFLLKGDLNVVGPFRLEAMRSVPVRAARDGIVSELRYREGDRVPAGAVIGSLDTFTLQKELAGLQSRAAMLEVEIEMARSRVPLVAAARAGEAATAAAELPRARVALAEASDVQRYRLAEAGDRVDEARALLAAARRKAERLRADVTRVARGDYPPALLALHEGWQKARVEAKHAGNESVRLAHLVEEGALASQAADQARVRYAILQQEEAAAASLLLAAERQLRHDAEDAEADLARARAAFHALSSAYHQVERQTAPIRVAAAREEVRARESVVRAARSREREASVGLAAVGLKRLERERLSQEIAVRRRRLEQSRIVASVGGVVATRRLDQKVGQQVRAGEAICTLDLTGALQVRIFVDERDVGAIRQGALTRLKVAAFPERVFTGEIAGIARRSVAANGRNSYEVRLRIEDAAGQLMPGMTGWAKIGCGQRPWAQLLGRRLMRYIRTEAWSWL